METAYIQVIHDAGQGAGTLQNSVVRDRLSGKSRRDQEGNETGDPIIKVQFNPSTLSFSTYDRKKEQDEKKKTSLLQNGQEQVTTAFADDPDPSINLSFKLIFDRSTDENADVQPDVEKFIAMVRDPYVRQAVFCWGDLSYKGVLRNVEAEYVLFNPLGVPTRATVSMTLEGV